MRLTEVDIKELLPVFMRDDRAVKGLSAPINNIAREIAGKTPVLSTWNHIEELDDSALDELAWELNIFWYVDTAPTRVKREIIKSSDIVFAHMGTKHAVERVATAYFGEVDIDEWFEYDGNPGYFKIFVLNIEVTGDLIEQFKRAINQIKRASAWIDDITVISVNPASVNAAVQVSIASYESYRVESGEVNV
jgi:phage tail P2-like protein